MLEKRFVAVPPQLFTTNGTTDGKLTVAYSGFFKVKQQIIISATALPNLELEIKRINNINEIEVGPKGPINNRADISAYTTAAAASISANEQFRPLIPSEEIIRAVYEEEPTVAYRVMNVDKFGNEVDFSNSGGEWDGITPIHFDDVILTRDMDEDIIEAKFYLENQELADLELTYDACKYLIRVKKVGP